jgi:hypothetical protein
MNPFLMWFLIFWACALLFFLAVGGYFMFRKFFKVLPMADGKSKLDRQNEWLERARGMWTDDAKAFLDELVSPVPSAFRDIARHSIAAKIAEVALEYGASEINRDHCLRGYILATPQRDYNSLIQFLDKRGIDYSPYKDMLGVK